MVSIIEPPLDLFSDFGGSFFVKWIVMTLFYERSYQRARSRLLIVCVLLLLVPQTLCAGAGTAVDFRVSGIIRIGEGLYRGLVESLDGKKEIIRQGDNIDQWKVVSINAQCIILSKDAKIHEECLSGTGSQEASKQTQNHAVPVEKADTAIKGNMSHFKQMDKVELLQSFDSLALKGSDLTMENISEAVLPLTDLPAGYYITELNAKIPESAQSALNQMRQQVDNGELIRLTLQNQASDQNIIYLQTASFPPDMK